MARAQSGNTGAGNFKAPVLGESAAGLKKVLEGTPKINHPNRHLSTNQYKQTLKKVTESDA